MATEEKKTTYPKITNKTSNVKYWLNRHDENLGKLDMVGTVKLHGMHMDLLIKGSTIRYQSRNLVITPELSKNACGFWEFMDPLQSVIFSLRERYITRLRTLHPEIDVDLEEGLLIVAGEWCGRGIQRDVGVSSLSKRWVICSVWLEGAGWLSDLDYADIHNEDVGIYHASRGGVFRETLDFEDIEASEARMQVLADAVDKECPFSKTFGIDGGVGEGIVWKPVEPKLNGHSGMWLKTKGPHFAETSEKPEKNAKKNDVSRTRLRGLSSGLAKRFVTQRRLEQGLEFLNEHGKEKTTQEIPIFLQWVVQDVLTEERDVIEESEVVVEGNGGLKGAIEKIARQWYMEQMKVQRTDV